MESHKRHTCGDPVVPVTIVYGELSEDSRKVPDWRSDLPEAVLAEIPGAGHNAIMPLANAGLFPAHLTQWMNPAAPLDKKKQ
jgi:hypothetical protein